MTAPWKKNPAEHENPFLTYYDAEMRYLREAGGEFAQSRPVYPRIDFEGAAF
ncbi:hypothetical protein [Paraburkholderia sp.]|jgi:type VI secretion system protein ImpG|uniref:hypothetical protein n=1 Tax=Paraburkholderia sp. TaxID=1926495 RepID=UPI002F42EBAF